jgi:hypothetical protein
MNIHELLKNVGYEVSLELSPEIWIATLPERLEDTYSSTKTIEYNIKQILENGVPKYCVTYYILTSLIQECNKINYNISLINYFDEDGERLIEDEVVEYFSDDLDETEFNKLTLLNKSILEVAHYGLTQELIKITKKYGIYKDFILIYNIVTSSVSTGDLNE